MKLTNNLDFLGVWQALGLRIELLGADPGTPGNGQIWINTSGGSGNYALKWNDNGTIRQATHLAQILALRLDQFAAPNVDLNMNTHKITNLVDPTSAQDAVTKNYIDNLVNGRDWKESVRVATTVNIATLSGLLTIDGITLVVGDRVLVKDQTTASLNGIYVAASGAWARSADADTSAKVTANLTVMVSEGTTNADKQFQLTTNDAIVLGTTSLTFVQTGSSVTFTNGSGITISSNVISIDTSVVTRKYSQDIGDGSTTAIAVTHNLNTTDIQVGVRLKSDMSQELVNNNATSVNVATLFFGTAPAANSYRVTIQG